MSRLRIGVIGLGAAVDPHAKSLQELADLVDVRACVSRSTERAQAFTRRFGFPAGTDIDAVITDPTIEALVVLTPPAAHLSVAERCFAAGKHILLEKPLGLTLADAEQLVRAGRNAGLRLGVVLQHRFRPASLRLATLLRDGGLDSIAAASVAVPWWRPQSYYDEPGRGTMARDGGGVLMTQAIHTLDLFRSLVGVRKVVAAQAITTPLHRMETEDYVNALIQLANGAPGNVMATTAAYPGHAERIDIIGTLGTAALHGGSLTVSRLDGSREVMAGEPAGSGANPMDFPNDAHRELLRDFVSAVRTGRDPAITGEDALASQQLIADILAAAAPSADGA